jgi:hypothetical protein
LTGDIVFTLIRTAMLTLIFTSMGFIGGWLLFGKLWWRLFARRVTGVQIGKRQRFFKSAITEWLGWTEFGYPVGYHAVYRYTDAGGRPVEAMSVDEGTHPAQTESVRLMVFAHHPDRVRETGGSLLELVGAMFLCPALYELHLFLLNWSAREVLELLAGLGVSVLAARWLLSMRRQVPARSIDKDSAGPLVPATTPEGPGAVNRLRATLMWVGGLAAIIVGIYLCGRTMHYQIFGVHEIGTVVALKESSDNSDDRTEKVVVRFSPVGGKPIQFEDDESPGEDFHVDEELSVVYLPGASVAAMIDRGYWECLWYAAVVFFGLAIFGIERQLRINAEPEP